MRLPWGEYLQLREIEIADGKIYVLDNMKRSILQYDINGKHLNTFALEHRGYQLLVDQSGNMIVTGSYLDEYMLNIYDSSGVKNKEFFPREEKFVGISLTQTTVNSIKLYNGGFYVTNFFDPTIYYIKDNEIKPLAVFDFGRNNMSRDFFDNPQAVMDLFDKHRNEYVMGINSLTVTEDWIIFSPEKGRDFHVVYYDRKKNNYMTNKGFDIPFSTFFGGYNAPMGYTKTNEYYSIVDNRNLCEMIEKLMEKDTDYLSKYPFLKEIDPMKLKEEDNNPSIVFYSLK
jgi:hypothetical protein